MILQVKDRSGANTLIDATARLSYVDFSSILESPPSAQSCWSFHFRRAIVLLVDAEVGCFCLRSLLRVDGLCGARSCHRGLQTDARGDGDHGRVSQR